MFVYKSSDIVCKCSTVLLTDSLTKDGVGRRIRRKSPAAKRDDPFNASHLLHLVELGFQRTDVNFEVTSSDIWKRKVNVGVFLGVDIRNIHVQAWTILIPGLEISDVDKARW